MPAAAAERAETPRPAAAPRRPRRRAATVLLLVVVAVVPLAAAGLVALRSRGDGGAAPAGTPMPASAVVLPLTIDAAADDGWLRLGGMDLVAERLRAGGLGVPPSENVVALLQDVDEHDDAAVERAVRRETPYALVVRGRLAHAATGWNAELRATSADGATLRVESTQPNALDAARDATDRLLARLGRARAPGAPLASGSEERLRRAQAAMLANDLGTARAMLVGDAELARGEPQLGYRLAQVDFRAGEYVHAEVALDALLAGPAAAEPLFRARLLNARGAVRLRSDDYPGAAGDYDAAITLLGDDGPAPELGLALTGRGVAHSMRREFAPAHADLAAARIQLEAAGDALGVARVDSNLGGLEMNSDRPEQALAYLDGAAETFERYGAIDELIATLGSLVSDNLALLRPTEALAVSDRETVIAPRVIDPSQRLNLVLDRVDALLALGRLRDAAELLRPLPVSVPAGNPFVARRLPALRARLALGERRYDDAAAQARRALALRTPGDDFGEGVAEIALVLQTAVLAAGPPPAQSPTRPWVTADGKAAYSVVAVLLANWAAARGDEGEAERRFREALDLAERRGVPADIALVAGAYGPWLLDRGRIREAGEVIGRASPWAKYDFGCALLELKLFHTLRRADAWADAHTRATALAGDRTIPASLRDAPH
ncbi:MAG TPA: hypothetical protein VGC30_14850, partial [Dokdonella sp.]